MHQKARSRIEQKDRRVRSFQTTWLGMSQLRSPPVETVETQATPFFCFFLYQMVYFEPWVRIANVEIDKIHTYHTICTELVYIL